MAMKRDFPAEEVRDRLVEKGLSVNEGSFVTIVFKERRSFDLHIGDKVYRFVGQESICVPRSVLTHKDWTEEISDMFIVKE